MLIPKRNYIRDKAFRKFVASLPCMRCGVQGRSQAAHFEKGGRSLKGGDDSCRPLCGPTLGDKGCHSRMDQYEDPYWTKERKQEVIDLPVYETWKSGDVLRATGLIVGFR